VPDALPGFSLGARLLVIELLEVCYDLQCGRFSQCCIPFSQLLRHLVKLLLDGIRGEVIWFTSHRACFLPGPWPSAAAV
jgi:hypothetical protein